jgi:hypothetical protein
MAINNLIFDPMEELEILLKRKMNLWTNSLKIFSEAQITLAKQPMEIEV